MSEAICTPRPSTWTGGVATWSEAYQYDGFGNLTGKNPGGTIQPVAPYMSVLANPATNCLNNVTCDGNGNVTTGSGFGVGQQYFYDIENRLATVTLGTGFPFAPTENYLYGPDNKRMYKNRTDPEGGVVSEEVYVYGLGGEKLATCGMDGTCSSTKVYFAGKLIAGPQGAAVDRLVRCGRGIRGIIPMVRSLAERR